MTMEMREEVREMGGTSEGSNRGKSDKDGKNKTRGERDRVGRKHKKEGTDSHTPSVSKQ